MVIVHNRSIGTKHHFPDLQMRGNIIKYINMKNLPTRKQKFSLYNELQYGMFELRLYESWAYTECIKSVVDILLSVDIPVLPYNPLGNLNSGRSPESKAHQKRLIAARIRCGYL